MPKKSGWGGKRPNQTGRPPQIEADFTLNIRVDAATIQSVVRLAEKWQCSKSEAIRRAINEAAK